MVSILNSMLTNPIDDNKEEIEKRVSDNAIIYLHDYGLSEFEKDVVESIIEGLRKRGYEKIEVHLGPGSQISIDAKKFGNDYCTSWA